MAFRELTKLISPGKLLVFRSFSTSAKVQKPPFFRYLSAWFCPFAHRATIALEHHAGRISYEWVEALGWEKRPNEDGKTGTGHEWWYHWKSEELKKYNPSALVSGAQGRDKLVPDDPVDAALCRIWADKLNKECCSPYYAVLVRKAPEEQRQALSDLLNGLRSFSKELEKTSGPLFLADAQLSSVDIAILPWAWRYYVFEHYRGPDFAIPRSDPSLAAYFRWLDYVVQLPQVQRTLPDKQRYLEHIAKYADSSARSKVANAVRRGAAAHDLDDRLDDY